MVWRASDPQGDEASKIKWDIVPYTIGRGIDVGCGPWKPFAHFIGVDNMHHGAMFGLRFKPDVIVEDCTKLEIFATESLDFVFSAHLLEHVEDYAAALAEWWRLIKVGGHLVLYLPHKAFYPNIGQDGANPDHKHDFFPSDITDAMMRLGGWDQVEDEERNGGREYSFFQVYRKRADKRCVFSPYQWKKPGSKMACGVRYGGFGDLIQSSACLTGRQADGWHATVMTTPRGRTVLLHDPHIDRFLLQDSYPHPDQVPNPALPEYWAVWEKKFDRWINLCESVEGTLLALPERANHGWPQALRHKMMDVNYIEFTHDLAGVPLPPRQGFYPSPEEVQWAKKTLGALNGFTIMWVLAGSSMHKIYPHQDAVMARTFLALPDARFILCGDEACQVLEAGWENEKRVLSTSGKWSVRETLTVSIECDSVIGPETGVLNAVGLCENQKIVLLSHSSKNNLTRDWVNTHTLVPDVPCHPCHRIHKTREFCPEWRQPVQE